MSTRTEVLLWAQRVIARKGQPAHVILEVPETCGPDDAQKAFHNIARTAHPDLHRKALTPDELETLTSAYATVAGAYQTLRNQVQSTQRMKPLKPDEVLRQGAATPVRGSPAVPSASSTPRGSTTAPPPSSVPITPSGAAPSANASQSMSSKALIYYRKAELALKRGDLKGALLQIKLAIATDPHSGFLRTALAEVELEVRKGT